ncbi:uncharacterized protein [Nicotiana tomentosiformis]|uniref:uncharacterized protein n=1 Tax=Nicotiana tomentosiformis TaxID=4098 RepID=UPI00051B7D78
MRKGINNHEGNKYASRGIKLSYIAPTIQEEIKIVELEKEEVDAEMEKWRRAVILYVVGESTTIGAVERFIASQWKITEKPRVYYYNEGYFLIHFHNMEYRNRAMSSTPNTINNKPIIMREWTTDFNFKEEMPSTLPLWVRFPNLPMNCWGVKSLSRIASSLGVPIYVDDCTTRIDRISYARVLIEIDITKELPDKTVVRDPNGRSFEQEVTYDWRPIHCNTCLPHARKRRFMKKQMRSPNK